jgi:hypothetical protein
MNGEFVVLAWLDHHHKATMSHSSCPCHYARQKMEINKKNSWQPMRWASMHPQGPDFLLLGRVGCGGFVVVAPIKFPIAPHFIPSPLPGYREPAPTSTGCPLLLSCGWTSTELIFGFTLLTNPVGNRSHV